jgi:hypothetical protein
MTTHEAVTPPSVSAVQPPLGREKRAAGKARRLLEEDTHGNAVRVLLANALGLSLALLEGVLVLKLAAHVDGVWLITDKSERRYVEES